MSMWEKVGCCTETYCCRHCGVALDFSAIIGGNPNYCPNCGKKMKIKCVKGGDKKCAIVIRGTFTSAVNM